MISVRNLSCRFGDLVVLDSISLEIAAGEVISIIGPSGAGKSTLLRCLNLLTKPTGGAIYIDGVNLLDPKTDVARVRQKMNMVFQSFNLFDHLSVMANLTIAPIRLLHRRPDEARKQATALLKLVGLAEKAGAYPDKLSGGQKQRVAIARCMAMEPEIILFDEPTSALDPTMVSEVLSVIRRLAREGLTMVIVTHEMAFARDVSTRVLYLDDGIIYEQGTPEHIFDRPEKPKTRAFINRIRSYSHTIASRDFDRYELNAEFEAFADKQLLPPVMRQEIALAVECLLRLHQGGHTPNPLDLTLSYSEKGGSAELLFSGSGDAVACNGAGAEELLKLGEQLGLTDGVAPLWEMAAGKIRLSVALRQR